MDERRLNLTDVSKLCGIAYSTLRDLYTGKNKNPLANTLKKMAKGFEVEADYFIDLESIDDNIEENMEEIFELVKNASPKKREKILKMIRLFEEEDVK